MRHMRTLAERGIETFIPSAQGVQRNREPWLQGPEPVARDCRGEPALCEGCKMPLKHILGADHVVITVRDLDAAAAQWRKLGFTLSPRGTHSPQMGSGNYTIMFGEDYLELLGVLHETEQNKPTREFLKNREGIERTAFTTDDAAAGAAELSARGLVPLGPVHFGRPVDLPNGGKSEAKFNVF